MGDKISCSPHSTPTGKQRKCSSPFFLSTLKEQSVTTKREHSMKEGWIIPAWEDHHEHGQCVLGLPCQEIYTFSWIEPLKLHLFLKSCLWSFPTSLPQEWTCQCSTQQTSPPSPPCMFQVSLRRLLVPGLAGTQCCRYSCPSRATGFKSCAGHSPGASSDFKCQPFTAAAGIQRPKHLRAALAVSCN